ncbi:MAG: hypothetical protein AAGF99_15965 [Bacteroidota bacterium]
MLAVPAAAQIPPPEAFRPGPSTDYRCRCQDRPPPLTGDVRSLIIFVRFADDTSDDTCTDGFRAWPSTALRPSFADSLLATSRTAPIPDSSLTAYFLLQSGGHYWLTGDAHGYVTQHPAEAYRYRNRESASRVLDHGAVTREALLTLDDAIDFSEYDGDGDGHVDQIFFVARSMGRYFIAMRRADGVSTLGFGQEPGGADFDGMGICGSCAGSFNRYRGLDAVRSLILLFAHEYGHDLFNAHRWYGGHLSPILGNRVPFVPRLDSLGERYADMTTGYALMLGIGAARHEAIKTASMSAFERAMLSQKAPDGAGWIDCPALRRDTTVTLRATETTGDCVRLDYTRVEGPAQAQDAPPPSRRRRGPPPPMVESLYLSNLQAATFFSTPTVATTYVSDSCSGCRPVETGGPHDTGLLAERVSYRVTAPHNAVRDVLPADNGLEGLLSCEQVTAGEGIEAAEVFDGDLWDPDRVRQLTPWTRPNSFGTTFQHDAPRSMREAAWPAFTNLRYADRADGTISFDYVSDVREAASFTVDAPSWIDAGSDGLELDGHLTIGDGGTLVVEDSVTVAIRGGLRIESGGHLELHPGATLLIGPGASIDVNGQMRGEDARLAPMDASQGWAGIQSRRGGDVDLVGVRVVGVRIEDLE